MICTDENIANVAYYLHQKSNMLPMVENNFGRNGEWLTFHESLNHDLYTIENGKLDLSYAMDFPNYKLPKKLHELSGMEVIEELQRSNYASIINYLENHDYIFLNVLLNNEGERIPEVYYWIISKNLQEEVIIKIDGGILQNPICLILSICLMIINYIVWGIYGKIRMWNPLRKI